MARNVFIPLNILWAVCDVYLHITLTPYLMQLCLLTGAGSTLYEALTVISELLDL